MKKWDKFSGTILILSLFVLDSALGSVGLFMGQAETNEEWFNQLRIFEGCRSVVAWFPYILVLVLLKYRVLITWEDEMLALLCLIMSVFDTSDYFINANWRPVWMDWIVFILISLPLIIHKVKRLRN